MTGQWWGGDTLMYFYIEASYRKIYADSAEQQQATLNSHTLHSGSKIIPSHSKYSSQRLGELQSWM